MLKRWHQAVAASLLIATSCHCGSERDNPLAETDTTATPAVDLDARTIADLESFGADGCVVLVIHPDAWTDAHRVIAPMLAGLDLPSPYDIKTLADVEQLPQLVRTLLGMPPRQHAIEGWDLDRPITASLFESELQGPVGSLTATLHDQALPSVRHQLLIPATDTTTLVRSIATDLESMGHARPEFVELVAGARAAVVGEMAIAVLPENDRVRVVALHPVPDDPATIRGRLDSTPTALVHSPPVSLLLQTNNLIAAMVRPWKLRPIAVLEGSRRLNQALADVSGTMRAPLRARGTQLVLSAELLMSDASADLDETVVAVTAGDRALHLRAASLLTDRGAAIVDAMQRGAGGPFLTKAREPWLEAYVGANLRELLDTTTLPPGLTSLQTINDSGPLATTYVGLRFPFGLVDLIERAAKHKQLPLSIEHLPVAMQLVWTALDEGELPTGAVAIEWNNNAKTSALTGLISLARTDPRYRGLSVHKVERGEDQVTMVGVDVDPTTVIHGSGATPPDALARLKVWFAPIAAALQQRAPRLSAAFAPLGTLVAQWSRTDRALIFEAVLTLPGTEPKLRSVALGPPSTTRAAETGVDPEAELCLGRAGLSIAEGLRALSTVSPGSLGVVSAKALAQARPHLQCAAEHPDTRAAGAALRRMQTILAADTMLATGSPASAAMVLTNECDAGRDPVICARKQAVESLPSPLPPEIELPQSCGMQWQLPATAARVNVDRRGISMLDELVTATTLAARIGARRDPATDGRPTKATPVELTVDEDTTMAIVRPVLEALGSSGITEVLVSVRDSDERRTIRTRVVDSALSDRLGQTRAWTAWTLSRATLEIRTSATAGLTAIAADTAPSPTQLARTVDDDEAIYVHADDDVLWATVAQALAGACPAPILALNPDRNPGE